MLKNKIGMDNILAEVSEVAGTNMAELGIGGFGLLTSPTSALGRVTPHHRLVRRLSPGPEQSNLDLVGPNLESGTFLGKLSNMFCGTRKVIGFICTEENWRGIVEILALKKCYKPLSSNII